MLKLRIKFEYEWKNIYKQCLLNDNMKTGYLKIKTFENILQNLKVFVSSEDIQKLILLTNDEDSKFNELNYMKLADNMHLPKIYDGGQTGKYLEKVMTLK